MRDNNIKDNYGGKSRQATKSQNSWLIAVIIVLVLMLTIGIVLTTLAYIGGARFSSVSGKSSFGGNSVAVLDVQGEIGDVSARATYDHNWTMHTINELIDDSSNKGIVIRVNSPGVVFIHLTNYTRNS